MKTVIYSYRNSKSKHSIAYLIWRSLHLLPIREFLKLLLVILLAGDEVARQAVAVEVVVALRLDEDVSRRKPVQAYHTLTTWQVTLG